MPILFGSRSSPRDKPWPSRVSDAHWHTKALVWRSLPNVMVRLVARCFRFWCALRLEGRSFLGHMQTLLAKKHWGVDFGSLGARLPDGRLIPNARTEARSLGTQELSLRYPWASTIDTEIYLEGFRAGEQFARRTAGLDLGIEARASVAKPFVASKSGNSMPHLAVQQSTKHDPSSQPPSRE
jgi:hypothetical protein